VNRVSRHGRKGAEARPCPVRLRLDLGDEAGSSLIEVVVSAILLVMVAVGVLGAVDASTRSTAEERHRARAHSLAQDDLARMRAMRVSDLSNLNETRTVQQDGTPYEIGSRAEFVTDDTGTASCQPGTASADYILITSTVTWPSIGSRPPVVGQSIVAPPNGSVSADSGALAISVVDSQNEGIPGVGLSGSGAGSFSGSTGSTGCVIFGNLPAGEYTLTASGSSLVDRDGNPPQPQTVSVVAESTNTIELQYDTPGSIPVSFTTRRYGDNALVPSSADSVVAFNTGMTGARTFGTAGSPASQVTATSLFPFASPYSVYAGTCEGDNPNPTGEQNPPGAPAIATIIVPPGGSPSATIQLPALHLTVWSGVDASAPGNPVQDARVRVQDDNCADNPPGSGTPFRRTFTTNSAGQLPDPGLPYSVFDVCADDGSRQNAVNDLSVQDLSSGTSLDIYLQGAGSAVGTCP
jgi:Tfp pilus assembly protein PilV